MTPEMAIEKEIRVQALPGLNEKLGWAMESTIQTALASHRVGQHWAPDGWRVVAYAITRPFTKAERQHGHSIHTRRWWMQPCRWDRRVPGPVDAVRLDSIEAGLPSRKARPRPQGAPPVLDANGQRPCRWCSTPFAPWLDPDQTYCSTDCRDLWNETRGSR